MAEQHYEVHGVRRHIQNCKQGLNVVTDLVRVKDK